MKPPHVKKKRDTGTKSWTLVESALTWIDKENVDESLVEILIIKPTLGNGLENSLMFIAEEHSQSVVLAARRSSFVDF